MSCLHAEDDFAANLGFFWDFDSMASVEIIVAIERHFQITISDMEAEQMRTISALVQLVSAKVEPPTYGNGMDSTFMLTGG